MKFQWEVTEGHRSFKPTMKGGSLVTIGGRRRWHKLHRSEPTGLWHGEVFYTTTETKTGDWGDGPETKVYERRTRIVEIEGDPDRALVERRTAAIAQLLNSDPTLQ